MKGDSTENAIYRVEGKTLHILSRNDGIENESVPQGMFARWQDIWYTVIHEGITEIGDRAFECCRDLRAIILPSTIVKIGSSAFEGCESLMDIDYPEGLRAIYDRAFARCVNLKRPVLPSSLDHLGTSVFADCRNLESFDMRCCKGRYSVRNGWLYDNSTDTAIMAPVGSDVKGSYMPESAQILAEGCLDGYRGDFFRVGPNVREIGKDALKGCPDLEEIFVDSENRWYKDFSKCLYKGRDHLIRVPPRSKNYLSLMDIKSIEHGAFDGCYTLAKVNILGCKDDADLLALEEIPDLKVIKIWAGVNCRLPFEFADEEGNLMPQDSIAGHTYVNDGNGLFVRDDNEKVGLNDKAKDGYSDKYGSDPDDDDCFTFEPIKVKGLTLDDIAGLEQAKEEIYEHLILPNEQKDLFRTFDLDPSSGMLLYGPPGTGKTMLARAVACEIDAAFFSVRPSDILNKWVGNSENRIRKLFRAARDQERAVIFFDDFDSLGQMRDDMTPEWKDSIIVELLTQIQGLETHENTLLVLASTNRPWMLDSALMRSGRFSLKVLVPLPNVEARERIFTNRLSKVPHEAGLDFADLAARTDGYNGADIEEICNQAKIHRVMAIANGDGCRKISRTDLDYAMGKITATVNQKDVLDIERYARTGLGPNDYDYDGRMTGVTGA